ncbi:MAG TPA: TlpA disulfide reductase family protein [Gammaproteobacteria bacterium]|nr:TlpA disulfide reductase family protein [Gammaproteobacteria bacterium]
MRTIRLFGWLVLAALAPAAHAEVPAALGDLHGKIVWVDFWASWCAPCRRSFPWLNEMQRKYAADGLEIIGVNVDKDRKEADAFLAETPAQFALRFDPNGDLAKAFDVQAMPSSYVLDAEGHVLARHFGFRLEDRAAYEEAIRSALAAAGSGTARPGGDENQSARRSGGKNDGRSE